MAANFIRYNSEFLYTDFHGRCIGVHPGGGRDFPHPSRHALGPTQPPIQRVRGLSWGGGVNRPVRGVDHTPHIAPRSKKEWSYTSTPPLELRGLFQGELYVYLLPLYRGADYIVGCLHFWNCCRRSYFFKRALELRVIMSTGVSLHLQS
jgi:hypothetical protein